MHVYAIRHGETEENVRGIIMGQMDGTLTANGIFHAKHNARTLKDTKLDYIYTSDLLRCVLTAKEIKKLHPDTPLIKTADIREVNFGYLQGLKSSQIDWDKELGKDRQNGTPKGGESIHNMRERVEKFIADLSSKHKGKNVLLVTHAGVIRQLISMTTGIPSKEVFETIPILHDKIFEFDFNIS